MTRLLGLTLAGLLVMAPAALADIVQWDFDGTLESSNGGHALVVKHAAPAGAPSIRWTTDPIDGTPAKAARFDRGTYFQVAHGFAPNGVGFVDHYTVVMDVRLDMVSKKRRKWRALLQTQHTNNGDADWGINRKHKLGGARVFGGKVVNGQWHRLAFVFDTTARTATSYINGKRVSRKKKIRQGSRFLLEPQLLLFADNDKENIGGWVSSVQLHDRALDSAAIEALGGPTATGIARPTATAPSWSAKPPPTAVPGQTMRLKWAPGASPQGQADVVVTGPGGRVVVATVPVQAGAYDWRIDPYAGPGAYTVGLAWGDGRKQLLTPAPVAVAAVAEAPAARPRSLGQNLIVGGDFGDGIHPRWKSVEGKVRTRSGRLVAERGGDYRLRQDIVLKEHAGLDASMARGMAVKAKVQLGSEHPAWKFDDQAWFEVSALDGAGAVLRTFASLHDRGPHGIRRLIGGELPRATESLRVDIVGRHLRGTKNTAWIDAVDVRVEVASNDTAPRTRTITKGPFLQDVRGDVMTVMWETSWNPTEPRISWAAQGAVALAPVTTGIETRRMDEWRYLHVARLKGLQAETKYRYSVGAGGVTSREFTFRTAPKDATPFTIAWLADNQYGWGTFRGMLPRVARAKPDLTVFAGDIVQNGYDLRQWHTQWFESLQVADFVATTPLVFARGNHDGEWPNSYGYSVLPGTQSFYSFTYGNTFIIVLDTESNQFTGYRQHQWLKQQLKSQAYRDAAFRVVTMHKPPYTNLWDGRHEYDGESFVRDKWVPLFERRRVDLVVAGHAHAYERGRQKGVTYVVVGGAGGRIDDKISGEWKFLRKLEPEHHYNMMSVSGGKLVWKAFKKDGSKLDRFVLKTRNKAWKNVRPGAVGH